MAAAVQDDITSLREDMESQMESRIIAAVQRASSEMVDNDGASRVTFTDDSTIASTAAGSKRKQATSGQVGRFLSEQRKQKKDS